METQEFRAKNIEKIEEFLRFFPGEISAEGHLDALCSLCFKEVESKFLLQILSSPQPRNFRVKMCYIGFGQQDFNEKKAVFTDLMKTLLFLFAGSDKKELL